MSNTTLSPSEVAAMVREVTDEEVAFYHEHGWVMLPGLAAPELAAELRRVALELRRIAEEQGEPDPRLRVRLLALNPEAEPYPSFIFSEAMCRNAQRLIT